MKKLLLVIGFLSLSFFVNGQDTLKLYKSGAVLKVEKTGLDAIVFNPSQTTYVAGNKIVTLYDNVAGYSSSLYYSTTKDSSGVLYANKAAIIAFLDVNLTTPINIQDSNGSELIIEENGGLPVNLQDQTTDPIIVKFNRIDAQTTLSDTTAIDGYKAVLSSMTGVDVGDYIIIFSPSLKRFYKGNILTIDTDTIFLDTPFDVNFNSGDFVDITTTNLAVDGSVNTQTFGVRGVSESPIGITVDITRIIFSCITNDPVNLSKFADIDGGLVNGLVLRKRDGRYFNIFNVKSNLELSGIGYDFDVAQAINPSQGQNGFSFRLTFGGQSKIGVVIRLEPGEDLEFLVQDALQSILLLEVTAEGHITLN